MCEFGGTSGTEARGGWRSLGCGVREMGKMCESASASGSGRGQRGAFPGQVSRRARPREDRDRQTQKVRCSGKRSSVFMFLGTTVASTIKITQQRLPLRRLLPFSLCVTLTSAAAEGHVPVRLPVLLAPISR